MAAEKDKREKGHYLKWKNIKTFWEKTEINYRSDEVLHS